MHGSVALGPKIIQSRCVVTGLIVHEELWMPPASGLTQDIQFYNRPFPISRFCPPMRRLMAQLWYSDTVASVFVDDGRVLGVPLHRFAIAVFMRQQTESFRCWSRYSSMLTPAVASDRTPCCTCCCCCCC